MTLDLLGMSGAAISDCGRYRYLLWRQWTPPEPRPKRLLWLLLNPSTADGERTDATLRKLIAFTRAWGFGRLDLVNPFALRATDPDELRKVPLAEAVGPANNAALEMAFETADEVVIGWGDTPRRLKLQARIDEVVAMLTRVRQATYVWCLGTTAAGDPKHPLYLPLATARVAWPLPRATSTVTSLDWEERACTGCGYDYTMCECNGVSR